MEEEWQHEQGIKQQYDVAQHFAIYDHLFNGAYFYPTVQLGVFYEVESAEEGKTEGDLVEKWVNPVYRGNKLTPKQVSLSRLQTFISYCNWPFGQPVLNRLRMNDF